MLQVTAEQAKKPESAYTLYSPAYISNNLVFTAGCVGVDYATGQIAETLEEQIDLAFSHLKDTLEGSGSSIDKVLKVMLFISNGEDVSVINEKYAKVFVSKPARSCVVTAFPKKEILIEIECVAELSS